MSFLPISWEQLTELKKTSEKIEGFFLSTDSSDWDNSWAERGAFLYVCIRFLNDETVNGRLNKSAIPLLLQASNYKDRPEAESVLLLHPETKGIFYYKERAHFSLVDSAIMIGEKGYSLFDVKFNQERKITHISFLKEGIPLEDLEQVASATADSDGSGEEKDPILEATDFAKQHSSSCTNWPILNYNHSNELPDYLIDTEEAVNY